jgi:hypothetical protein
MFETAISLVTDIFESNKDIFFVTFCFLWAILFISITRIRIKARHMRATTDRPEFARHQFNRHGMTMDSNGNIEGENVESNAFSINLVQRSL